MSNDIFGYILSFDYSKNILKFISSLHLYDRLECESLRPQEIQEATELH